MTRNSVSSQEDPTGGSGTGTPDVTPEKLKGLIRSRGAHKRVFRRQAKSMENLEIADDKQLHDVEAKYSLIQNKINDIQRLDAEIFLLLEDESALDKEADGSALFDNEMSTCMSNYSNAISHYKLRSQAARNSSSPQSGQVRLPKIDIPKFHGDYTGWTSFWDQFNILIHQNKSISNVEKLSYLKVSLRGPAEREIASYLTTDSNYPICIKRLKDLYDNRRCIIKAHLDELFSLAPLRTESATGLRALLEQCNEHVRSLTNLGQETKHWDVILTHLLASKLDSESRKQWELHTPGTDIQTFEQMQIFLDNRRRALESSEHASKSSPAPVQTERNNNHNNRTGYKQQRQQPTQGTVAVRSYHSTAGGCLVSGCKERHRLTACQSFKDLAMTNRFELCKTNRVCFNCLQDGHSVRMCPSQHSCRECKMRHHTLLHRTTPQRPAEATSETPPKVTLLNASCTTPTDVLLATAMIEVTNNGQTVKLRALLDSGSQASFIREDAARALQLNFKRNSMAITGMANSCSTPKTTAVVNLGHDLTSQCFVVPEVTKSLPGNPIDISSMKLVQNLKLADPTFHRPGQIDLLLGADVYEDILLDTKIKDGHLYFKETLFGFVISGPLERPTKQLSAHMCSLDGIQRFWELEEVPNASRQTVDEVQCVQHYDDTTQIASDGRTVVQLPFRGSRDELGSNRESARRQFFSLERRLQRNQSLQTQYIDFINEFISMGHLEEAPSNPVKEYFLPHHGVAKESSSTTKLRVVFNASCSTTTGKSLNDCLLVGPKTQDDLFAIIVRFRFHRFVISGDVAKMYRQIALSETDRDLHRLFWRESPALPLKVMRMTRVTYGVASSSYHSTRALKDTAERHGTQEIRDIVNRDFYVDDLYSGASTLVEAIKLQDGLISTLSKGLFPIRKFSSNVPELVTRLPAELQEAGSAFEIKDHEHSVKALGITWKPIDDLFCFVSHLSAATKPFTKRVLLSEVSKLFDPLGWLTAIIVSMKILIQQSWTESIGWDDELPDHIFNTFANWVQCLSKLSDVTIPRQVLPITDCNRIDLHLFCDASERAFAACIYVVTHASDGATSNLLVAKSKVAPLKSTSLPRLELCGMHLGAKLLQAVHESLAKLKSITISTTCAWSDSTIALAWVSGASHRWCTFVANRVADIQQRMPQVEWRHVSSPDNPADIGSRGTTADCLVPGAEQGEMWWHGPAWLRTGVLPVSQDFFTEEEQRASRATHIVTKGSPESNFISPGRFSNIHRLVRVLVWCRRWRTKQRGFITLPERRSALLSIAVAEQKVYYAAEFQQLRDGTQVDRNSKIVSLYPFIDEIDQSVIRVGGRLAKSNLHVETKYPILLPKASHLSLLITRQAHQDTLHGTTSLVMAQIRQRFWIVRGIDLVRKVARECMVCVRFTVKPIEQLMGDLPKSRTDIQPRAFTHTGLDFAGPFATKDRKGEIKSYMCLFVCLATKAVHLELCTDLSSTSCLAAIKRFVARRGLPTTLLSDNGSNFVGLRNDLMKVSHRQTVTAMGIEWRLIPPSSPHFGGIWEAGVKSAKHHLRRILGLSVLTYEELNTLLCQIEQILNSRPLTALPDNPADQMVLTPAHLCLGAPQTFFPEAELKASDADEKPGTSPKKRWVFIRNQLAAFWRRWSREYVSTLQQRKKWTREHANLKTGDVVLISDDNTPPLHWPVGRVVQAYAGHEEFVRVARVKTTTGTYTRPITKLRKLPVDEELTAVAGSSRPAGCSETE